MKFGRLSRFLRAISPWWPSFVFLAGFGVSADRLLYEHRHDECLPATCTAERGDVQRSGGRNDPILVFHARKPNGEFLGRYIFVLDEKGHTREEAQAIADADARRRGETFPCYYHPEYRGYVTTDRHGRYGYPVAMAALALLMFVVTLLSGRRQWRERRRLEEIDALQSLPVFTGKTRLDRLYRARDFLPEVPPPGWSASYVTRDEHAWMTDVGELGLLVQLLHQGPIWGLRVHIVPRGSKIPASDARCAEVLGQLRRVGDFIECAGIDELPGVRVWLGLPHGMRPRWRLPPEVQEPREARVHPFLAAARKHLPEKLPAGWSVPVAMTDDRGTTWKDGAWMFAVDDLMVLVALCTSKGRIKLCVSMFYPPGEELSEGDALDVLKHFRGVVEFSEGERHREGFVAYFGDIGEVRRDLATLN
jgi:hypothetical protein